MWKVISFAEDASARFLTELTCVLGPPQVTTHLFHENGCEFHVIPRVEHEVLFEDKLVHALNPASLAKAEGIEAVIRESAREGLYRHPSDRRVMTGSSLSLMA